jgi:hypothetical protein
MRWAATQAWTLAGLGHGTFSSLHRPYQVPMSAEFIVIMPIINDHDAIEEI